MKKRINNHQRSTIKKVMNYIRRYWGYLGMSIVLAAVTVALTSAGIDRTRSRSDH